MGTSCSGSGGVLSWSTKSSGVFLLWWFWLFFSPFIKRKVSQDLLSIDILCRANWQYVEAALDTRAKREELKFSFPTHSVLRQ